MTVRHERMERERKKRMARTVRTTLLAILRRGSIVDSDDPDVVDASCHEQEKIAKHIEAYYHL